MQSYRWKKAEIGVPEGVTDGLTSRWKRSVWGAQTEKRPEECLEDSLKKNSSSLTISVRRQGLTTLYDWLSTLLFCKFWNRICLFRQCSQYPVHLQYTGCHKWLFKCQLNNKRTGLMRHIRTHIRSIIVLNWENNGVGFLIIITQKLLVKQQHSEYVKFE